MASHFVWLNRSKESLALDLKEDEAKEALHRLVAEADVFVQNLAPGGAARLGFGAEELRERAPAPHRLRRLRVRRHGPVQGQEGLRPAGPVRGGVSLHHRHPRDSLEGRHLRGGHRGRHVRLLGHPAALLRRERTGEGATLDVSMLESLGEWMGFPAYFSRYGGEEPKRSGASHAAIAPYGPFECGDGEIVFFGHPERAGVGAVLRGGAREAGLAEDERFASNSERVANRADLRRGDRGRLLAPDWRSKP